jgi:hypothetical protein
MNPKYSNIFWHEGVKVFDEKLLGTEKGRIKIQHLENDVTKALVNLFQHCGPKVLRSFLAMINVKEAPQTFDFDFQVTDTQTYRNKKSRIMLSIVSAGTRSQSKGIYSNKSSIPDACIFSNSTAILIESKTQSPLIREQLDSHIKHYLGTATSERLITWEDVSERFRMLSKSLNPTDNLLVEHFCGFLELIGISDFNGFSGLDFNMLGNVGKISHEDYADFKRLFRRKLVKFMELLKQSVQPVLDFKNCDTYVAKVNPEVPDTYCGFYFYDKDPRIHLNRYPNINLSFEEHRLLLSLNAETRPSVESILSSWKKEPTAFAKNLKKLKGVEVLLFYKLQYLPMNHFIWNPIPGFPLRADDAATRDVNAIINAFENQWKDVKHSLIYEMASGGMRHSSGRLFNRKEVAFATEKNPRPNYAIRIAKQYAPREIEKHKKSVVNLLSRDIAHFRPLAEFVLS